MMPIGRLTRSRASIFQPLNVSTNPNNVNDISSKSDVSVSESVLYKSDKAMLVKSEQKSKRRRKQTKGTDDQNNITINNTESFTLDDSIWKSKSLVEITNKDEPQLNTTVSDNKYKAVKKSKQTKTNNSLIKNDATLESSIRSYNNPDIERDKLNPECTQSNVNEIYERKTTKKRGRTKKIKENNVEVKNIEVDNQDRINIDLDSSVDSEIQLQYKRRKQRSDNDTNSVREEDTEVMSKKGHCNKEMVVATDDVCEPKRPQKRGKYIKGKRLINKSPISIGKTELENVAVETSNNVAEISTDSENSNLLSNWRSKRKYRSPLGEESVNNLTVTLSTNKDQSVASELDSCIEKKHSESKRVQVDRPEEQGRMPVPVTPKCSAAFSSTASGQSLAHSETPNEKQSSPKQNKFAPPRRSGTFTIDDDGKDAAQDTELNVQPEPQAKQNQYEPPKRGNTFTLDDNENSSPRRSSLRLTTEPAPQKKTTPKESTNQKSHKSIGARIMSSSMKKNGKTENNFKGSTVKKTIQKKTPGSTNKTTLSTSKKLPNFKLIHQKLFGAMESLDDNIKRKMDRAQGLINSPIVPKCAVTHQSPRGMVTDLDTNSTTKLPTIKIPENAGRQTSTTKTVSTYKKQNNSTNSTSVNRFGFKTRIDKTEAIKVIQNKLPLVSVEHRKNQERGLLKGVRMNKRFLLQMKMRENLK